MSSLLYQNKKSSSQSSLKERLPPSTASKIIKSKCMTDELVPSTPLSTESKFDWPIAKKEADKNNELTVETLSITGGSSGLPSLTPQSPLSPNTLKEMNDFVGDIRISSTTTSVMTPISATAALSLTSPQIQSPGGGKMNIHMRRKSSKMGITFLNQNPSLDSPKLSIQTPLESSSVNSSSFPIFRDNSSDGFDCTQILPWLYLSGDPLKNPNQLQQVVKQLNTLNIQTIINLAQECQDLKQKYPNLFQKMEYTKYDCLDHAEDLTMKTILNECIQQIEQNQKNGSVLVHCQMGHSRSATVVIAYLMHSKGMGFDEAYSFVKEKREAISPNLGFISILREFEKDLKNRQ